MFSLLVLHVRFGASPAELHIYKSTQIHKLKAAKMFADEITCMNSYVANFSISDR